jgi:hypothetical protein
MTKSLGGNGRSTTVSDLASNRALASEAAPDQSVITTAGDQSHIELVVQGEKS